MAIGLCEWSLLSDLGVAILSAIVAAGTWAALLFIVNALRSIFLERRIRSSFRTPNYSFGVQTFGLNLRNRTGVKVKVWEVAVVVESPRAVPRSVHFNYGGEKKAERNLKLDLPTGERLDITTSTLGFESEPEDGAVELDFDMEAEWGLSNKFVVQWLEKPIAGYCLIEYRTLIGTRKRVTVEFEDREGLCASIQHHRNRCLEEPEKFGVEDAVQRD